jgi:hypothetical protein
MHSEPRLELQADPSAVAAVRLRACLTTKPLSALDQERCWTEVVELVASGAADEDPGLIERCLGEIAREAILISERTRASTALAVARPQLPVDLVKFFASQPIAIAAPVLSASRLNVNDWRDVAATATLECASFLNFGGDRSISDYSQAIRRDQLLSPSQYKPVPRREQTSQPTNETQGLAKLFPWSLPEVVDRIRQVNATEEVSKAGAWHPTAEPVAGNTA